MLVSGIVFSLLCMNSAAAGSAKQHPFLRVVCPYQLLSVLSLLCPPVIVCVCVCCCTEAVPVLTVAVVVAGLGQ